METAIRRYRETGLQMRFALALAATAITFDLATTYVAFGRGAVEANPIMEPMFSVALLPWIIKFLALPVIVGIAAQFEPGERRILSGALAVAALLLVGVSFYNLTV